MTFFCRLRPSSLDNGIADIVKVSLGTTLSEVKEAVKAALSDSYFAMEKIEELGIEGLEDLEDEAVFPGSLESGNEIIVTIDGVDSEKPFTHQRSSGEPKVVCEYGARDNDGEQILLCGRYNEWRHAQCCGFKDANAVSCIAEIMSLL